MGSVLPSRLTIEKVWDIHKGKEIDAKDLINQPEDVVINLRRQLETAISINSPRLVCPICHQMVRLSGRKTERGKVTFFSHLYDSDACYIKTTTGMTREQIEARKYALEAESDRHKFLKKTISQLLQSEASVKKGISDVKVEKNVTSPLPYLRWRRPDIQAKYNGLNLVFEIQLSTTFVSTIVDRDIFYRLNNYFIIWVFNFDDNQEYVNLSNLMCKDIYYANKRNVFIFDKDAQRESINKDELIFKCDWLDPDNTWHFRDHRERENGHFVSIDQLTYDNETSKPFVYDADKEYFKSHPEAIVMRHNWEISREEIVSALIEKDKKENDLYDGQSENLRDKVRQEMARVGEYARPFSKHNRWGLSYNDIILLPPLYSSISDYNEFGYAFVSKGQHKGLVDRLGNTVISCDANDIRFLSSDLIIYRKKDNWYLVGASAIPIAKCGSISSISLSPINDQVDSIIFNQPERPVYILLKNRVICYEESRLNYKIVDFTGNEVLSLNERISGFQFLDELILIGCIWREGYAYNGHSSYRNESYPGVYDYSFNEIIPPRHYQLLSRGYNGQIIVSQQHGFKKSGVISEKGAIIIPLDYTYVSCLSETSDTYKDDADHYYLIKKNSRYGVADINGGVLIPCMYKHIEIWANSSLLVRDDLEKAGIISINGEVLLQLEFDEIRIPSNDCFVVVKNKKSGVFDTKFNQLIPCIYDEIQPWGDSHFKVKMHNEITSL